MEWFRHYHGLASDPKLTAVALTADVHHCMAVAAWCFVLEQASANVTRGNVTGLSAKVMAIGLRISLPEAERLIKALEEEGLMLPDGSVRAWEKRQRKSDTSADRVRKWRGKQAGETPVTKGETPQGGGGNVTDPPDNVKSEAEKRRTEKIDTPVREAGASPEPAKAALWREMKAQIGGKDPGSLAGKWVKLHGLPAVTDAHFAAMANPPADYVEWMTKRLQANGTPYAARQPKSGRSYHDLVTESLTDDEDHGLEAVSRVSGEVAILRPGRTDDDPRGHGRAGPYLRAVAGGL